MQLACYVLINGITVIVRRLKQFGYTECQTKAHPPKIPLGGAQKPIGCSS